MLALLDGWVASRQADNKLNSPPNYRAVMAIGNRASSARINNVSCHHRDASGKKFKIFPESRHGPVAEEEEEGKSSRRETHFIACCSKL